jgi:FixJ family two-component response regulator
MKTDLTVYVVDDDPPIRDSLSLLLGLRGYRTAMFASGEDFLAALQPGWRGCLLTDLRLPGMSGLDLQQALKERGCELPVVIITGHGDVAAARAAFRSDAVDFLEKPFDDDVAIHAIESAFDRELERLASHDRTSERARLWGSFTEREHEVAARIVQGAHNKQVAAELGISPRTVEVHRARIMEKAGAASLAELIKLAGTDPP